MYELINGSERLMGAIERRVEDPEFMVTLADLLFYDEDQLAQDIKALSDRCEIDETFIKNRVVYDT